MTNQTSTHPTDEDLAAYALGVTEGAEAQTLATHLAGCTPCQAEVARFQLSLSALAVDRPAPALPAGHRDRFQQKLAGVPAVARAAEPIPVPPGHRERLLQKLEATQPAPPHRRNWWNPFASWALAGALAAALILAGLWGLDAQNRANTATQAVAQAQATVTAQAATQAAAFAVLGSPAAQVATLAGAGPGQVRVWVDPTTQRSVMFVRNLPAAPADRIYELWVIAGGTPVAVDVFQAPSGQDALMIFNLPPGATAATAAAITVETAKVPAPTTPPILVGNF